MIFNLGWLEMGNKILFDLISIELEYMDLVPIDHHKSTDGI